MSNILKSLARRHYRISELYTQLITNSIRIQHGHIVCVVNVGVRGKTNFIHNSRIYKSSYTYKFVQGKLESIVFQCDDSYLLADGLCVTVDDSIREAYRQVFLSAKMYELANNKINRTKT